MTLQTLAPLAAGAMTAGAKLAHGDAPRLRVLVASVAGSVILGALAPAAPALTRVFAYLVILGALLGPGYDLVQALTRLIR